MIEQVRKYWRKDWFVVTRTVELATVVYSRDEIQRIKCAARKIERGMKLSDSLKVNLFYKRDTLVIPLWH